jgi:carbon-monoxide dehydrogenase medium subunit
MIPAAFDYVAPTSLDDALSRLHAEGDDAKILAGGHSLLPLMKLRLAAPALLIDLGNLSDLRYIRETDGWIEIGSMTTYAEIERSHLIRDHLPLLAQAASLVGDAQVRHRGTIGGAMAHADPAGDIPAVAVALSGEIRVRSVTGIREIASADFFVSIFETVLTPSEIVTELRFPIATDASQHYEKFRRRMCDWAIVGSAVNVLTKDDRFTAARVVLTNVGPTPIRATVVESALLGATTDEASIKAACDHASDGLDPTPEFNASTEYKKHLSNVITRRAVSKALGRA